MESLLFLAGGMLIGAYGPPVIAFLLTRGERATLASLLTQTEREIATGSLQRKEP